MQVVTYNQLVVKTLFGIFLLTTISVSIDFGIFAASSMEIKQTMDLNNLQFGAL